MQTTRLTSSALTVGADLYIRMAGAVSHCAVATAGVYRTIVETTDKAIKVQGQDEGGEQYLIWLPKKALVKMWTAERCAIHAEIAGWFHPDSRTCWKLAKMTTCSVLSVA